MRRVFSGTLLLFALAWWLTDRDSGKEDSPRALNVQIERSAYSTQAHIERDADVGSDDRGEVRSQSGGNETQSLDTHAISKPSKPFYVIASALNIRSGPATTHRKIAVLANGAMVNPMGKTSGDWVFVSHAPSQSFGWVHSAYLADKPVQAGRREATRAEKTPKTRLTAASAKPKKAEKRKASIASANRAEAMKAIIRSSIAGYPGSCPCPYNYDRAGRRCGGRSAYSRPGGYAADMLSGRHQQCDAGQMDFADWRLTP